MQDSTPESRSEDREKRQEHREERHEAREIISSRESEELKFKREHDYENLAKIPMIELNTQNILAMLEACNVKGMRSDLDWLKGFFWLLASAVVTEFCGLIALVIFRSRG